MPITIRANRARPGFRLVEPFMFQGTVMLPGGKVLTEPEVEKLHDQFSGRYLRVHEPILDHNIEFEDDSCETQLADLVQSSVMSYMTEIEQKLQTQESVSCDIHGTGHDDFSVISDAIKRLIELMEDHPSSVAVFNQDTDSGSYLAQHSAHVFYLSIMIAMTLRSNAAKQCPFPEAASRRVESLYTADLLPLGLGAMCADVGLIPHQHLFNRTGKLSVKNRRRLNQHPLMGAQILPRAFPATAKMVVRTHHENFDGSGYPNALVGSKQHVFTRIVRVADAYTAATSRRIYPNAGSAACVLWEMAHGPCKRFYDPAIVNVLAGLIQPFPIGSMLKLRDERTAVVVRHNRQDAFSPVVVVAFGKNTKHLPADRLVGPMPLDEHSGLQIKSFEGEDLSYVYDSEPTTCSVTSCHCSWTADHDRHATMFEAAFP